MPGAALFPLLMGPAFITLHPRVQRVHRGESALLSGIATIERGRSPLARVLCALARLPAAQVQAQTQVRISASVAGEEWTRYFGDSPPMRSTLSAGSGLLIERLGPATLRYRLVARADGIDWRIEHIAALGIPLPRALFRIAARCDARADRYHFVVDAGLRWVGRIIRYEGELDLVA